MWCGVTPNPLSYWHPSARSSRACFGPAYATDPTIIMRVNINQLSPKRQQCASARCDMECYATRTQKFTPPAARGLGTDRGTYQTQNSAEDCSVHPSRDLRSCKSKPDCLSIASDTHLQTVLKMLRTTSCRRCGGSGYQLLGGNASATS